MQLSMFFIMIDGSVCFTQVICRQIIITYQTATCVEYTAGDFGFSSGSVQDLIQNQKTLRLRLPPSSSNESVIGCFC